eukprot:1454399-Rhodomonas_salina.1
MGSGLTDSGAKCFLNGVKRTLKARLQSVQFGPSNVLSDLDFAQSIVLSAALHTCSTCSAHCENAAAARINSQCLRISK